MEKERLKQQAMHKNFFDRCEHAIDSGFHMEAILMEYAAIEARLEVLLGVLGLPCNKFLSPDERKRVQISHRITCADYYRRNSGLFARTKLPQKYFKSLKSWIDKRNRYVHGLYKNEIEYDVRMKGAKAMAEDGLKYCRLLYGEVSRLRRLKKSHPEQFDCELICSSAKCTLNNAKNEGN